MESIENKLQKQYEILEDIFSGTTISSEVEAKFQDRYDEAETKLETILSVIDRVLKLEKAESGSRDQREKDPGSQFLIRMKLTTLYLCSGRA